MKLERPQPRGEKVRAGLVLGLETESESKFDLRSLLTPEVLADVRRELVEKELFKIYHQEQDRRDAGVLLGKVMAAAGILDQALGQGTIPLSPSEQTYVEQEIQFACPDLSSMTRDELNTRSPQLTSFDLSANAKYRLASSQSGDQRLLSDPALEFFLPKILRPNKAWSNLGLVELAICRPDQQAHLKTLVEETQVDLRFEFTRRFKQLLSYGSIIEALQAFLLFFPEKRKDFQFTQQDAKQANSWIEGDYSHLDLLTKASHLAIWLAEDAHLDEHGRIRLSRPGKSLAPAKPLPDRIQM